jgi:ribosomal protein L25 (general stress protein Ctc)
MAYSEFLKTFRISGESQIITLIIEKKEYEVLVHDIQKEPVS